VYSDLDTLLAGVDAERPDVVLTDIRMPPTYSDEPVPSCRTSRCCCGSPGSSYSREPWWSVAGWPWYPESALRPVAG